MLATILLLGLVLVAAVTDLLRRKVYNWTTYGGIVAAFGISAAGSLWLRIARGDAAGLRGWLEHWLGWHPLRDAAAGVILCGGVMLVCFVLFRVGGGDVKLIAMLGAFLGVERGVTAMLLTFVLGGCLGLCTLVWRIGGLRLIVRTVRQGLGLLGFGSGSAWTEEELAILRSPLHLAPGALAAVVLVLLRPWPSWFWQNCF